MTKDELCEELGAIAARPDTPPLNRDMMLDAKATIERLSAALEPFDEAFGEDVDDDFGDDTPVVVTIGGRTRLYALTLGDFRRIRAALGKDASDV